MSIKKKVKCTLVQALRHCTGRTAHRGSTGIPLPFYDHGTRRWWRVSVTPRPLFSPGKDLVFILQRAGWAPRPVWTGAENLASTGIRSPDRPARSQSLYRLRYPAHHLNRGAIEILQWEITVLEHASNQLLLDLLRPDAWDLRDMKMNNSYTGLVGNIARNMFRRRFGCRLDGKI